MIALAQISASIAVLVFKLLNRKVLFITEKAIEARGFS